jgi:hypothetical protein
MHFFNDIAFHQSTVFFNINAFFTFNCSYSVALLCQHIYTTVATWVLVNWAHSKGPRVGVENEGLVAQGQLRVVQKKVV